ncbi:hypothetical protein [Pontibacter mangrovi]|uniref:STAS/SEC14 domain-containing protein n=1 Tax=Pontibacter mangrovi TaxID=2589816 RepID=A0A501WG85_9BACT|nr:hypothetical protein [Pontibacter mangrovi]TPE46017.1 hypothetical protein FJM65_01340 [Pontibacter mangrovi]
MTENKLVATDVSAEGQTVELHQSGFFSLSYSEEDETLIVRWRGEVSSEELRNGYVLVMDHVRQLRVRKWQLDLQNRDTIRGEDQRWIFEHVFQEALRVLNCDIFVAVVLPVFLLDGLVSELSGDELMHDGNFLIMQHFMYREEAQRWLNEMHQPKPSNLSPSGY